jgi:hypothetical protein
MVSSRETVFLPKVKSQNYDMPLNNPCPYIPGTNYSYFVGFEALTAVVMKEYYLLRRVVR